MIYLVAAILFVLILILWRLLHMSTFADAITQLRTDIAQLVSQGNPQAIAAAVAAKDAQDAAVVQDVDAAVKAALTPAP